jgi:DNA polymerase-3 subunit alpha
MDRFAAYGFNKSHAAAYCVVAAQTAWLKRYYPVEFYAALLSTEMSNTEKVVQYTKDARSHGIEVKPPHINYSDYKFAARGEQIFFGLGAIKGVGEGPIENIVRVRSELPDKKFHSIEEFFDKMDGKTLNKKVLECLIKAGALDDFGATRAQLWACYETLLERSGKTRKDREIGQTSLFELESADTEKFEFPTVVDWRKRERLAKEKEVLGFFLSDHPLIGMDHVLDRFVSIPISKLKEMEGKSRVIIGGLITGVRERLTRKATLMAFFSVEDLTGETEVIAFPDSYDHIKRHLVEDEICLITGVVERDGDSIKVIAEDLITLENKMKTSKRVLFRLLGEKAGQLDEIKSLIEKHPGDSTVQIELNLDDQYGVLLELENNQGVVLSREFFESVQAQFGATDFVSIH